MHDFLPDPNMADYASGSDDDEAGPGEEEVGLLQQVLLQAQFEQTVQLLPGTSSQGSTSNDEEDSLSQHQALAADGDAQHHVQTEGNWNFADSEDEEAGATAEEVYEIEPAIEATRDQPPDIEVGAEVIDVKFHPSTNIIAAATLDAEVVCYRYSTEKTEEVHSSEHHESALRAIAFSRDGGHLLTASKDHTVAVLDTATWKVKEHYLKAHEASVYSLCSINENLFASGDDDGVLKLWDIRKQKAIFDFRCGEETINSIITDDGGKTLVAAVDDGSIASFNVSKRKLIVQSEMYAYPLSCLAVIRNGTRLAVGSENGNMLIFKWGEFAYHMDCVTDQPQQINCMEAIGDNRVITGCEDGYIRAVNLYPHRFVGVVGRHQKYGVENISISCDQRYLASCCQDDTVHFWDLQHLYSVDTEEKKKGSKVRDLRNNLLSSRERNPTEFFADMTEDIPSDEEYMGPVDKPKNIE